MGFCKKYLHKVDLNKQILCTKLKSAFLVIFAYFIVFCFLYFVLDFVPCIFGVVKRNAKNIRYTHTFLIMAFKRVVLVSAILVLLMSAFGKIFRI